MHACVSFVLTTISTLSRACFRAFFVVRRSAHVNGSRCFSSAANMTDMVPMKRALISVSDKGQLLELAAALKECGVQVLSTGGTAKFLKEAGLEVTDVSDYTGFPEMMDGRVKTLHPKVFVPATNSRCE